jgi:serine/threonine protein kinase
VGPVGGSRHITIAGKTYPCTLDDFLLLDILGTGTFGQVNLVHHKDTGKFFALKILRKSEVVRLKQVAHINAEKEILSLISHPFIISLYCTFKDPAHLYLLLEYAPGGEIFSHLRKCGRFSANVSRFYIAEIVLALEHLHNNGVIYRDLKPENLLLDPHGHVKLADFGFAKRFPPGVAERAFTLCGTPEYIAPEIIQSKGHGRGVDWWALGILMFEMLAGYPPFYDDNPFGIYEKILDGVVIFPSHIDPIAQDLISRLLEPDLTRRLGTMRRGADDIKSHQWFAGVDWDVLYRKQIPAPIVPKLKHEGDTVYFDKYPPTLPDRQAVDDTYDTLFSEF